jgi:hypothetical protein
LLWLIQNVLVYSTHFYFPFCRLSCLRQLCLRRWSDWLELT